MWNPRQYAKFATERVRPFLDLTAQIVHPEPRLIVDLGCGTGELTRMLAERWPQARVLGIDQSVEMLRGGPTPEQSHQVELRHQSIEEWRPDEPVDIVVSNAALQWIPSHDTLLPRLVDSLAPGGVLAVQMPNRFRSPVQREIDAVIADPRWSVRLAGIGLHGESVQSLDWYTRRLLQFQCTVNAWETSYLHILTGADPILEWFRGTALRPLLAQLTPEEAGDFEQQLAQRFRALYPPVNGVTLFPFPRLFLVAARTAG